MIVLKHTVSCYGDGASFASIGRWQFNEVSSASTRVSSASTRYYNAALRNDNDDSKMAETTTFDVSAPPLCSFQQHNRPWQRHIVYEPFFCFISASHDATTTTNWLRQQHMLSASPSCITTYCVKATMKKEVLRRTQRRLIICGDDFNAIYHIVSHGGNYDNASRNWTTPMFIISYRTVAITTTRRVITTISIVSISYTSSLEWELIPE